MAVPQGDVSNNWLPVAGIGILFLGGAVASIVLDGDIGRTAVYFVVATLVLTALTAPWLVRHPPALHAGTGAYMVLAVLTAALILVAAWRLRVIGAQAS
jgi:hypothetical protein